MFRLSALQNTRYKTVKNLTRLKIGPDEGTMILQRIYTNVIDGNVSETEDAVRSALVLSVPAEDILHEGLIIAMDEVGRRFEEGDFYVPEMLIAARAMQAGLKLIKPHLAVKGVKTAGVVAIGTVQGDLHDIGKNLVAMMLEGAGFEVRDLGVDVAPDTFVKAVQDGALVIGMSALLSTTMSNMHKTIEALEAAGVRDRVKVVIGGAPIQQEYARLIGADGFAADAASAIRVIRMII